VGAEFAQEPLVAIKPALGLDLLPDAGISNRRLDLAAVADNARVRQQAQHVFLAPCGDDIRVKPLKSAAKILSLAQDGNPAQARLKPIQNKLFPERATVIFGHAPIGIMIGLIERIHSNPAASFHRAHALFCRTLANMFKIKALILV
jgi:hypothetical protein